ncbi:hypothetical protein [Microbacterium sp. SD291]|uniref:hypothetical protein n=1 Tax=Microbacterium sp. SD291 TaxID=2782007 RepID=UPI001A96183E|nr:hypothetical protein [Microbacterium sp. SD291]MBO0981705.1 hypothetical protein [Microbacterium sp. SD291]
MGATIAATTGASATRLTTTGERPLADLLDRAATSHPAQADLARHELETTLAAIRTSRIGDLAWSASCLTPSRYPVEVAVTSARAELRTVVDVVAPEGDRRTAFGAVLELSAAFGAAGPPAESRRAIEEHQRGLPLRFGAWLGSRHEQTRTRHKVYVETGSAGDAWRLVDRLAPGARRVLSGLGPIRFLGLPLDGSDGVEVYVRPPELDDDVLAACLGRADLGDFADRMSAAMTGGAGRLRGRNHVVSASVLGGAVVAVAGFTFAHHRFRLDHRVRREMLARADAEQWPSRALYESVSRPLAEPRPMRRPAHTALSEVAAIGADDLEHHIGLAPPETRKPAARTSGPNGPATNRQEREGVRQ